MVVRIANTCRVFTYFALVVLLSLPASHGAEQVFSRSASFCPLDVTYGEMATALARIREFTEKANHGLEPMFLQESLTLSGAETKLQISDDFSEHSLIQGPQLATDVWYSFSQRYAPISEITIRLGDYSREVTVSGIDRTQVESLVLLASEDLAKVGCSFGGSSKRLLAGLGLLLLAAILAVVAAFSGLQSNTVRIALLAPAIVIYFSVLFFPWNEWLPGMVVRAARVSFLERNAAVIGFVGAIAGLVSLVIALSPIAQRIFQRHQSESGAERENPPQTEQPATVNSSKQEH